jgi:hypothetical protein
LKVADDVRAHHKHRQKEATSPAVDHGPTPDQDCPATDQRGYARPDPADGAQGQCDIGAFESGAVAAH